MAYACPLESVLYTCILIRPLMDYGDKELRPISYIPIIALYKPLGPISIRPYRDYGKPIEIRIAYNGLLS